MYVLKKKNGKKERTRRREDVFLPKNPVEISSSDPGQTGRGAPHGHGARGMGTLVQKAAVLQTIGRIREIVQRTKKSQSGGVGTLGPRGLTPWAVQCALQMGSGHLTLVSVVGYVPESTLAASHLFVMNGYVASSPQVYLFAACVRVENVGKYYF
jgi:hypothetical protein